MARKNDFSGLIDAAEVLVILAAFGLFLFLFVGFPERDTCTTAIPKTDMSRVEVE